jgi:hypothetical protein
MNASRNARPAWKQAGRWLITLGAAAALAACGGGDDSTNASADGSLRLAMTDAPSCGYDHVYVTVNKLRVNQSAAAGDSDAGWTDLTLSPARKVDLLSLTNGVLEELGTMPLRAGHYSQIRLVLADNSVSDTMAASVQPTGGVLTALSTPSAQQSGLKLQANIHVDAGQLTDLVLDLDACKSIVKAGNSGQYLLKPVITVFPRLTTAIQGWVSTALAAGSTTVSAQQAGVTVRATAPDANGRFTIPYLPVGTYSVVVASEGRSTAVVTSVPVSTATGTTTVNGTATAIVPPLSAMADVTGALTLATVSGTTTVSAALTDGSARALQALTGGPTVQLGAQSVDAVLGTYRFHLPVAAPVKAPYVSAATALNFAADAPVAGKFSIELASTARVTQTKAADISGGLGMIVNFNYGP